MFNVLPTAKFQPYMEQRQGLESQETGVELETPGYKASGLST